MEKPESSDKTKVGKQQIDGSDKQSESLYDLYGLKEYHSLLRRFSDEELSLLYLGFRAAYPSSSAVQVLWHDSQAGSSYEYFEEIASTIYTLLRRLRQDAGAVEKLLPGHIRVECPDFKEELEDIIQFYEIAITGDFTPQLLLGTSYSSHKACLEKLMQFERSLRK